MRYRIRRWLIAGSAFLALALLVGEGFLLSDNLHPGTRLLRSDSALKAMFHGSPSRDPVPSRDAAR
jgi:hypothetical protein